VKGGPEKLLEVCTSCASGEWQKIPRIAENFAKDGLRVLAMAYKEAPQDLEELTHHDHGLFPVLSGLEQPV
jgi:Ca2+-transporting ATPase